jgi:hypothetical protein
MPHDFDLDANRRFEARSSSEMGTFFQFRPRAAGFLVILAQVFALCGLHDPADVAATKYVQD